MLLILPLYDIFIAYPSFINALTEDAKDESVRIATHLVSMLNLKDKDSLVFKHETIKSIIKDLNLQKVKAFSPSGENIYTTDPEDTKNADEKREFYDTIIKGKVYAKFKQKGTKSLEGHILKADVVETYIPIVIGDKFLGAFEIYYDITNRKARYDKLRSESTILVIVLACGLLVLIIITSFSASKNISERKRIEDELRALSLTDELTGLYNRRGFFTLADQQLKFANRNKKGMFLLSADLDNLKEINDTLGHEQGDLLLFETASILRKSFRDSDIIARLGGDEFVILATETPETTIESLTIRLKANLDAHNTEGNKPYNLSFSMGMIQYNPDHPSSIEELLSQADKLMYEEKKQKQRS
jgi:diguanylate cyclase (GGDEF)-like protein